MLIEIPDPEVILGVVFAFLFGVLGFFIYHKLGPILKSNRDTNTTTQSTRLEYYERQLIDMKIRLDALEMEGLGTKSTNDLDFKEYFEKLVKKNEPIQEPPPTTIKDIVKPNLEFGDVTDHVLHLITNNSMTSRDIQTALKKSREHTSRLMKKLFDDGFVERNTNSKPYIYSITEKGKQKIQPLQTSQSVA